jgi:hypothetical protein
VAGGGGGGSSGGYADGGIDSGGGTEVDTIIKILDRRRVTGVSSARCRNSTFLPHCRLSKVQEK